MRNLLLLAVLAISGAYGQTSAATATSTPAVTSPDESPARTTTRTIEGRVLTKAGAPVPGAVVLIKDSKTLQVRSYIAQADGQYHFFGLSNDVNYNLRAENQGLTSKDKNVSVFDSHKIVKLNLKLTKQIQQPKTKK